ncbi:precorrin-3B synthase [Streptomyces corynorhini]|uniref:Precorrin-3B synthase n=2 Tax=Streptomyces corynorhini TaxID=2282652 RepID=A0A370AQK8_9ACTN|nr:precorrin-3B synthase [Streptomyces corynorhini]
MAAVTAPAVTAPVVTAPVRAGAAPVRERGDACPGALRLHPADDGRLARLRLPAGHLTYRQARTLATAAERLGDGHLDITSRGNLQLRGLGASCGGELAELLREAGLLPSQEHERVRNIVASPLSGVDEVPPADVFLWARELDALLCASPAATALSGRFLFALDDGRGDVASLGADVTLLARRDGTATVHTGTNHPGLRVAATDAPRAALLAAETFLTVAAASGSGAWRVAELPAGHGGRTLSAAVAARLAEAGIAAEAGITAEAGIAAEEVGTGDTGTGSAGTAGSAGARAVAAGPPASYAPAEPPAPGIVRSPDGTSAAVSVYPPLGRLSVAQWRALLSAERDGSHGIRLTPWRGVVVPGLEPAAAERLLDRLRTAGLITAPDSPWHGVGACTGRPGCAKALADVRSDAATTLRAAGRDALPVHWSGCARRCGHPQGDHVNVIATAEGDYTVSVTGPLAAPVPPVPPVPPVTPVPPVPVPPSELAAAVATARTSQATTAATR